MRKWLLVGLFAIAGCEGAGEAEESPERLAERRLAYRQACATGQLLSVANDDVATLEDVAAASAQFEGPLAGINRTASEAALEYSRAYQRHAELRAATHAALDSAVNHSATTADSARYIERAGSFTIRSPSPGSVEENVLRSYVANLTSLLDNPDHPCNWDLPF